MPVTLPNGVIVPNADGQELISATGVAEMRALGSSADAQLAVAKAQVTSAVQAVSDADAGSRARDAVLEAAIAGMEGMTYVGAWESGATYRINDVVTHGGDSWARLTAGDAGEPGADPAAWGLVARKGDGGGFGELTETDVTGLYEAVDNGIESRIAAIGRDTGAINVTSSFPQVTNGGVTIRRYGQMVHVTLYDVDFAGVTPPTLFYPEGTLPPGYRPATNTSFPALVGSTAVCRIRFQANGQILLYSFPAGGRVNVTASWLTPNPWPAG